MLVEKKFGELSLKAVEIYPIQLKSSDTEFNNLENKIGDMYTAIGKNSPENKKLLMELEELEAIRANALAEFLYKKGLKDCLEIIKTLSNF